MKNLKNVISLSESTVASIILSVLAMTATIMLLMANASFAKELGDEFGGPGIGMLDCTWDGSVVNRIYGYGDLNGIEGDEVVETNALWSNGPTKYIEYDETNPINHYLIDMGPKSASNEGYSLLFINDGGPGMTAFSNALGSTVVYNDGGPGFTVSGLSTTQSQYVDNGPTAKDSTVNPSDILKLMNMKPGDFTFAGGTKADKVGK